MTRLPVFAISAVSDRRSHCKIVTVLFNQPVHRGMCSFPPASCPPLILIPSVTTFCLSYHSQTWLRLRITITSSAPLRLVLTTRPFRELIRPLVPRTPFGAVGYGSAPHSIARFHLPVRHYLALAIH